MFQYSGIPNYETSRKLALIEYLFTSLFAKQIPANCARHFKDNTFETNNVSSLVSGLSMV